MFIIIWIVNGVDGVVQFKIIYFFIEYVMIIKWIINNIYAFTIIIIICYPEIMNTLVYKFRVYMMIILLFVITNG